MINWKINFKQLYFILSAGLFLFWLKPASALTPTYVDVQIPTADGKFLAADVYLPAPSGKFPTIYVHTPYKKENFVTPLPSRQLAVGLLDPQHYAYVISDWRGFYGSTKAAIGVKKMSVGKDGYDVVEWIAKQKWSNGKIGLWGHSAPGEATYRIAAEQPPHLTCLIPSSARVGSSYDQFYTNGAPKEYYINTLMFLGFNKTGGIDRALQHPLNNWLWHFAEMTTNPDKIDIPLLAITGWYDDGCDSKMNCFFKLRKANKANYNNMKLIIGPWEHLAFTKSMQGCLNIPEAKDYSSEQSLRFFDYYLRDQTNNGWDKEATIRYFQMGDNKWIGTNTWPPSTAMVNYYLHSNKLDRNTPNGENPDSYSYNPNDPYPSVGGAYLTTNLFKATALAKTSIDAGPQDIQGLISHRNDQAVYTSNPLEEDLVVAGDIALKLYVSSDCNDTDFVARVTDVYPDGRSILITDGVKRMSLNDACSFSRPIEPRKIYPITIPCLPTAQTFEKGHRLQIVISSSSYPAISVNKNIWHLPLFRKFAGGQSRVATNTVYHDSEHPSQIVLPVIAH